jgi:UPF0755 protein
MSRQLRYFLLIALALAGVLACVVIAGAALLLNNGGSSTLNPLERIYLRLQLASRDTDLKAATGSTAQQVCFRVNSGDSANQIALNLQRQGLIKDSELFRLYARYNGFDARLQAGTYALRGRLTIPDIVQTLTNIGANTVTFRITEGWRLEEIAEAIDRAAPPLSFRGADFLNLVGAGRATSWPLGQTLAAAWGIPAGQSFEGFLFPDTYTFAACATAEEAVTRILRTFDSRVDAALREAMRQQGLTLYQAVTLASIVEREAAVADERPLIAGVYLNRLRKPMTLDADPTVQYALGRSRDASTWWPQITQADYQGVQNPYNTYVNQGLPPGPIANPGLSALQAAASPQTSQYLYFRASCTGDGRHRFAVTFEEHLRNGC